MLKELFDLVRLLDFKTKNNLICMYLAFISITIFLMSIFLQKSITFVEPVFLTVWSMMCLSNVAIYWSVTVLTEYMSLEDLEDSRDN